jgi:hypothetical protein
MGGTSRRVVVHGKQKCSRRQKGNHWTLVQYRHDRVRAVRGSPNPAPRPPTTNPDAASTDPTRPPSRPPRAGQGFPDPAPRPPTTNPDAASTDPTRLPNLQASPRAVRGSSDPALCVVCRPPSRPPAPQADPGEQEDGLVGRRGAGENDLRCAIHTPGLMAQVNAQAKAQVNAQVIFPRTSVASKMTRKSFCQLRKSFCLPAQAICPWA